MRSVVIRGEILLLKLLAASISIYPQSTALVLDRGNWQRSKAKCQ
jgi:hypothetical protein